MRAKANFTINKHHNHYKDFVIGTGVFLISFFIAGVLAPVESSNAITCVNGSTGTEGEICNTSGSTMNINISNPYYITVSSSAGSSEGISLHYGGDSSNKLGDVLVASDTITTTSNTGQTKYLYISTTSSSNNLTNNDTDIDNNKTYIKAGGGDTLDSPTALSSNTWGFNIEDNNNFTKVPVLGNELLLQAEVGTETIDEDTKAGTGEYVSTKDVYYGVLATNTLDLGTYTNTIVYTALTTLPPDTRTIEDIEYMQEMNKDICDNTPESTTYNQYTLKDKRGRGNGGVNDGTYTIVKAKDGNCWMSENFDLYGKTIYAADSDFKSGSFEIPANTTWSFSDYATPKVHQAATSGWTNQIFYNWTAAVALEDGTATEQQNQSICPKGWQLPVNGSTSTNKSYAKLWSTYGVSSAPGVLGTSVLGFTKYYGMYNNGSEEEFNSSAYFWSSTPSNETYAYYFFYYQYQNIYDPGYNYLKGRGCSLRCVSRD